MKRALVCAVLVIFGLGIAHAQNIVADWHGSLKVSGADLHLVLHITRGADGNLKATLDSIDQGAKGIPVNTIALKDSKLSLSLDAIHATYEGKVNADASGIDGTWSQGQPLELNFTRGEIAVKPRPKPAKPSDIDGDWLGTLDTGMAKLRLALHIANTEDGLTATMDSLDQGANGMPVTTITQNGSSLKFEMKAIGGAYDGNIGKDLQSFEGMWTQGGRSWPLVFKRVKNASELELRRPQNPVKPYPYREEEVSYNNPAANIKLAATLTIPPGKGPFPAVLLIAGSGPHDRDESLMGHRPFLVLADYLTRKGIVVLRADKRGAGKSSGSYASATMADFSSDADAGVAYLKTRAEVDPRKIGLVGHSEGGLVAPMAAAHNSEIAFVVMMAGPGVPGDQILPEQLQLIEEASGKSHDAAAKDAADEREILALVEKDQDDVTLEKALREKLAGKVPEAQIGSQIKMVSSPWFRNLLRYDPASALSKVTCPVLDINGEKDLQVPPEQNLPPIRKALEAAGNKNFEVDELPGLNHLFQTAKTGGINEYSQIEETMSPVALERIAIWILKQTSAKPPIALTR